MNGGFLWAENVLGGTRENAINVVVSQLDGDFISVSRCSSPLIFSISSLFRSARSSLSSLSLTHVFKAVVAYLLLFV